MFPGLCSACTPVLGGVPQFWTFWHFPFLLHSSWSARWPGTAGALPRYSPPTSTTHTHTLGSWVGLTV